MTTRERTMSIALISFIVVAGGGFVGYSFIWAPLKKTEGLIATAQNDVDEKLAKITAVQRRNADVERWRKMSLPTEKGETNWSASQYAKMLNDTLKESGFDVGSTEVIGRPIEAKASVPNMGDAKKTPIYRKLEYNIKTSGDLASLVDWMERFYKVPLLHEIHSLTMTRPSTTATAAAAGGGRGGRGGGGPPATSVYDHLSIVMTVEALVLDTAENRKTLLPEKVDDLPKLLSDRQFASIGGKNLFFGPYTEPRAVTINVDVLQFIKLDGFKGAGENRVATLFDAYHNHDYEITPLSGGKFKIVTSWYVRGAKRQLHNNSESKLEVSDDQKTQAWYVVRIDDNGVILRDEQKKNYYQLRSGYSLADVGTALTADEIKALDIKDAAAEAVADKK